MSILIEGMEMPKKIEPGLLIEFADGINGKRYARLYHFRYGGLTDWFESVPIPPHGDLIERKDTYDSLLNGMVMTGYQSRALDCISEFYVPTIIPADEEDE